MANTTLVLVVSAFALHSALAARNPFLVIFRNPFPELVNSVRQASQLQRPQQMVITTPAPEDRLDTKPSVIEVPPNVPNTPCLEGYKRDSYGLCREII